MLFNLGLVALAAQQVAAFPWVVNQDGVDSTPLRRNAALEARQQGGAADCPFNPNHQPAAPITAKYPYCGAAGGKPGKQTCPGNLVPAKGDTAHAWQAPTSKDIRGPCPGINTAANHNFLARDGITNFTELIDMQQNVYGVGYDLAVLLAVLGVGLDGDPIGTTKLSIGCDATSRTANPAAVGPELGLNGHNKFEGDTSLTRNDYFTHNGDNFKFNRTLYKMMSDTCKGNFNLNNLALYRSQRYKQSLNENGNFYFGPKSLLLYGAASFLYELFPSLGGAGVPDQTTMDYFFTKEQLPPNWLSRVDPYTIPKVGAEIFKFYSMYPVAFGGNTGKPNTFVGISPFGPSVGNLSNSTPQGISCLLYQVATENDPAEFGGGASGIPDANFKWMAQQLKPIYTTGTLGSFGCPLNFNGA